MAHERPAETAGFPPSQFDDYEVMRPLGAGGMGTVYLGHDLMLDRPVALKFISDPDPDPRARDRFVEEARAIARLHHPNVVGIYRIGTVADRPYLAYELIDGQPLQNLPRPMAWRRALELGLGVARGLAAVHGSGVLHRDIKPSNIVVGLAPKLIDFGLARRLDDRAIVALPPADVLSTMDTQAATRSGGVVAGTPLYMAPELWVGVPPSAHSDVYALGLVLWELLGGDLPYGELGGDALVGAIVGRPLPSIASRRGDLPAPLVELIDRCVDRDPQRRPSAATLRDQLEALRALYAPLVGGPLGLDDAAEAEAADALSSSLGRAAAVPQQLAARFYHFAFAAEPALRPLFPADMRAQHSKVVSTLQTVVRNARSPELIVPLLEDLGERHAHYGVVTRHFDVMGQALLAALAEAEGPAWTPALEALWQRAYQHIAEHMDRGLTRAAAGSSPRVLPPVAPTRRVLEPPPPRYARSGDAVIAYQVFGDGPRELVVMPGWISNVELAWHDPAFADFLSRLARRSRVIMFDRRGTGLSDRTTDGLGLDHRLADLLAVLDAAGAERPALLGIGDAAGVAAMLAATHPERVRGLVLVGGTPCLLARPGVSGGVPVAAIDALCAQIVARWGEPLFVESQAPSRSSDDVFRAWWARLLRSSATPAVAIALLRSSVNLDLRAALPVVRTPALVLHRKGDRVVPLAGGQALARLIPGARLHELDGDDHLPYAGDRDAVLAAIEGFLHDMPTVHESPVRLVTVLAARTRPGATPPWRRLVKHEGGTVVELAESRPGDGTILLGTFAVPAAALRAVRAAAAAVAAAAVHTVIVTARAAGDEAAAWVRAAELAATAADGALVATAIARDLAAGELGEVTPGDGDDVVVSQLALA